jgi:hypothetical protein
MLPRRRSPLASRIVDGTAVDTELRLMSTQRRELNAGADAEADVETEADCVAAAASMLTRDRVYG